MKISRPCNNNNNSPLGDAQMDTFFGGFVHVIRVNPRVTRYPKIRSDHLDKTCLPWPWPAMFDNQLPWQLFAKYFKQLNTINHVWHEWR